MNILILAIWLAVGVLVIRSGSVTMTNYVLCWVGLILALVLRVINEF